MDLPTLVSLAKANWPIWLDVRSKLHRDIPLPDDATLRVLTQVALEASLSLEEGRRVVFKLLWTDATYSRDDVESNFVPSFPRFLRFDSGRQFNADEIRRLAPATDPSFEAIEVVGVEGQLTILGTIQLGDKQREYATNTLDGLTIEAPESFSLRLARKGYVFLEIRRGRMHVPVQNTLVEGHVNAFFWPAIDDARNAVSGVADVDVLRVEKVLLETIRRLLEKIRDLGHGGLVLIIRRDAVRQACEKIRVKYSLAERQTNTWQLLLGTIQQTLRLQEIDDAIFGPECDAREFANTQRLGVQMREALTDTVLSIARLSQVDGALIITDHLDLVGFGAQVETSTPSSVHECFDACGREQNAVPSNQFGMRHRAAYGFVDAVPESLAFVLSQDGGMKAVRSVDKKVLVWSNVELNTRTWKARGERCAPT